MKSVQLNAKQLEATEHISGPLLILAGAGAGKTKTITERVVKIVKSGIDPAHILCVTFTNKAAAEMRERILNRLKEESLYDEYTQAPLIKTFHSLGLWILKRETDAAQLPKNFTILDSDDSRSIVKRILEGQGVDIKMYDPSKIRNAISREKGDFRTPEMYSSKIANYTMEIVHNTWKSYEKELRDQGAVDFDDLLLKTVEILRDNQNIREKYQNFFTHVHVDEYQDTNQTQYELSKLLTNPKNNNICVVGDTDQNIYSWRGANLKNIMNFETDFPGTKVVLLEENYRSTGNILELANIVIKKNTIRKDKRLFTQAGNGENIEILPSFDGESEAEWIALKCSDIIFAGVDPNEIAILYRTNFQSRIFEEKMLAHNVPYIVLGTRFFERKEIKDVLSYLRAAFNPKSQPDLKRVFETPKRGVGKVTLAKLFSGEVLTGTSATKVKSVFDFLQSVVSQSETATLSDVLTYILVESGIEKELKDDGDEGMIRLANISELITLAQKYDDELHTAQGFEDSLDRFLELSSLSSDQDDDKKESSGVRLMTVHSSKGLEFEYVFIVGLEEDLFPSKNFSGRKQTKEEEEEERRLFYVAVTRARKKLFLSFAELRTIFGQRNIAAPSTFISDVPDDIVDYHDVYYKQHAAERTVYY